MYGTLSIDEMRDDFEATIWKQRRNMDLKQVWFAGVHSDVGGGYKPGRNRELLSDIPLKWMIKEVEAVGLVFENHLLARITENPLAEKHEEYEGFFKVLGKRIRKIPKHTYIHNSVKERYESLADYRPETLERFLKSYNWINLLD